MPAITETVLVGTLDPVFATGSTAALANNALAVTAAYTPTTANYLTAEVEFTGTFATAPTAGTGLSVWFLRAVDGTNYEDGGTAVTPTRGYDMVMPFAPITTAQRVTRLVVVFAPGAIKVLVKNDGSGQSLSAGWGLKIRPLTRVAT